MIASPAKYAIIVAGGTGQRMGASIPKQFLTLAGKPVLWHTLNVFLNSYADLQTILVLPKEHIDLPSIFIEDEWRNRIHTVPGGDTRFQSVKNGLAAIKHPSIVLVHDAVRCLITTTLIKKCFQTAVEKGNAIPAIPATDSLRLGTPSGYKTIPRHDVLMIQTPQTFHSNQIIAAFEQPYDESFTDEATVLEQTGATLHFVDGDIENIKITRPSDLVIAEAILKSRQV